MKFHFTDEIQDALKKTTFENTVFPSHSMEVNQHTSLVEVLDILFKNNISSCPVRRASYADLKSLSLSEKQVSSHPFEQVYLGIVDLSDILTFFLKISDRTKDWDRGFEAVFETAVEIADHKVENLSSILPGYAIPNSTNFLEVAELFSSGQRHLVVVNEHGAFLQLVSQHAFFSYVTSVVLKDAPAVSNLFSKSLTELGLKDLSDRMITAPLSEQAVNAFNLINNNDISAVAVLNEVGSLVGNISIRDIRSMIGNTAKMDRLYDTVGQFLLDVQHDRYVSIAANAAKENAQPTLKPSHSPYGGSIASTSVSDAELRYDINIMKQQWDLPPLVTVTMHDSLEYVYALLTKHQIHRVYVTKGVVQDGTPILKPVGVVTLTDIFRLLSNQTL